MNRNQCQENSTASALVFVNFSSLPVVPENLNNWHIDCGLCCQVPRSPWEASASLHRWCLPRIPRRRIKLSLLGLSAKGFLAGLWFGGSAVRSGRWPWNFQLTAMGPWRSPATFGPGPRCALLRMRFASLVLLHVN